MKSTQVAKIGHKIWLFKFCFYGLLVSITVALVLLSGYGKHDAIVFGKRPYNWTKVSSIQGFQSTSYMVILPTITIMFLCIPEIFKGAKNSRFCIQYFLLLRRAINEGIDATELADFSIKMVKKSFSDATKGTKQNTWLFHIENLVWIVAKIAIASGITLFLIVSSDGMATYSTSSKFAALSEMKNIDLSNPSCLSGDWPSKAVNTAREMYVFQNKSNGNMIYAIGDAQQGDSPITVVGFGDGLSLWDIGKESETWRKLPVNWKVNCNITHCYTYPTGDPAKPIINPLRQFATRERVLNAFNQIAIIDPNLLGLAKSGTVESDKGLLAINHQQAVTFSILSGIDSSVKADIYRTAYLLAVACSVDNNKLLFENNWGIESILTFSPIREKPVTILSPCTIIWFHPDSYILILVIVFLAGSLSICGTFFTLIAWFRSPVSFWWPALISFSDYGAMFMLMKYPKVIDFLECSDELEIHDGDQRKLILHVNHETLEFRLLPIGTSIAGWYLVRDRPDAYVMRRGMIAIPDKTIATLNSSEMKDVHVQ